MAVIKVFDSKGIKTIQLLGNATEQDYDLDEEVNEQAETTDDGF